MEFTGSQTEKNLLAAFAGESQARTRYNFFAGAARKEGYEQISAIFQETSDNEREHAKLFFGHLKGGMAEIIASYPAGITGTTAQNLLSAAEGEKFEWGSLYPGFATIAEKEGFADAARTFRQVAKVEAYHEHRYRKLLEDVKKTGFLPGNPQPNGNAGTAGMSMRAAGRPRNARSASTRRRTSSCIVKITEKLVACKGVPRIFISELSAFFSP